MTNKSIPKKLITTLITTLTTLFLLFTLTTPANAVAVTKPTPNYTQITIADTEAKELIQVLEQAGFTKTATGNSQAETITLTYNTFTITFTKTTSPIQTRTHTDRWVVGVPGLSYGTDLYGFYLKMEGYLQGGLALGALIGPGGVAKYVFKATVETLLKIATAQGLVKFGVGLIGGIVNNIIDILSGACTLLKPRYIRFDPFRTSCGDPPHYEYTGMSAGGFSRADHNL